MGERQKTIKTRCGRGEDGTATGGAKLQETLCDSRNMKHCSVLTVISKRCLFLTSLCDDTMGEILGFLLRHVRAMKRFTACKAAELGLDAATAW